MMNGLKQSDPAILPLRAANKGTSVPAEPTEGRAGTKGNPRGQSTHRTQCRARVGGADTASSNEEAEGEAHCAVAPHHDGSARNGLLLVEEGGSGRCGRGDVA